MGDLRVKEFDVDGVPPRYPAGYGYRDRPRGFSERWGAAYGGGPVEVRAARELREKAEREKAKKEMADREIGGDGEENEVTQAKVDTGKVEKLRKMVRWSEDTRDL